MIKNFVEHYVESEYQSIIKQYQQFCDCDKCKNDALCIALNHLPTMYNTGEIGALYQKLNELNPQFKIKVTGIVIESMMTVLKSNRHDEPTRVNFLNHNELLIQDAYDSIVTQDSEYCHCETCKEDVFAIALNQIPPHYVTYFGNEDLKRFKTPDDIEMDVMTCVLEALLKVKQHPRHNVNLTHK